MQMSEQHVQYGAIQKFLYTRWDFRVHPVSWHTLPESVHKTFRSLLGDVAVAARKSRSIATQHSLLTRTSGNRTHKITIPPSRCSWCCKKESKYRYATIWTKREMQECIKLLCTTYWTFMVFLSIDTRFRNSDTKLQTLVWGVSLCCDKKTEGASMRKIIEKRRGLEYHHQQAKKITSIPKSDICTTIRLSIDVDWRHINQLKIDGRCVISCINLWWKLIFWRAMFTHVYTLSSCYVIRCSV